jgi:hypothetical protein
MVVTVGRQNDETVMTQAPRENTLLSGSRARSSRKGEAYPPGAPIRIAPEVDDEPMGEATREKERHTMNDMPNTALNALSRLTKTIGQYPIPAAIAALGLAWLFVSRVIRKESSDVFGQNVYGGIEMPAPTPPELSDTSILDSAKATVDQVGTKIDHLSKAARQLGDDAQNRAEHLGSHLPGTIQASRQDIADTAQKIAERVKNATS